MKPWQKKRIGAVLDEWHRRNCARECVLTLYDYPYPPEQWQVGAQYTEPMRHRDVIDFIGPMFRFEMMSQTRGGPWWEWEPRVLP
jgi:hypothetical protein